MWRKPELKKQKGWKRVNKSSGKPNAQKTKPTPSFLIFFLSFFPLLRVFSSQPFELRYIIIYIYIFKNKKNNKMKKPTISCKKKIYIYMKQQQPTPRQFFQTRKQSIYMIWKVLLFPLTTPFPQPLSPPYPPLFRTG